MVGEMEQKGNKMTFWGTINAIIFYSIAGGFAMIVWLGAWMMFEQTELGQAIINTITKERNE